MRSPAAITVPLVVLTTAICSVVLVSCKRAPSTSEPGGVHASAYAPYWYVDDRTDSTLEIKNRLDSPLTVVPILRTAGGRTIELPPMTVAPRSTSRLDVNQYVQPDQRRGTASPGSTSARWGDGSRPSSVIGTARLTVTSPEGAGAESFGAWIFIKNRKEGLGLVSPFHQAHPARTDEQVLEGLWWIPFDETRAYFALQNTSQHRITVQVEMFGDGHTIESTSVSLEADGFALIDVEQELGGRKPPETGGIRFTSHRLKKEETGGLMARGLLVQEKRGFCTPLNLYESNPDGPAEGPTELQAPVAYFGRFDKLVAGSKDILSPHLLLRNTTARPLTILGTLYGKGTAGRDTAFAIRPVTLSALSSTAVNLEEERRASDGALADGVAGLRVIHDGRATDVVAELVNVSLSGNLVLYDRMRNLAFHTAAQQVAISFNLEDGHRSFLILKNTTERPQRPRVLLDHSGAKSPYEIAIAEIAPQQVTIVDIQRLRDHAVPGTSGETLPREASFGGARIISEPGGIVSSDPTVVFSINTTESVDIVGSCMVVIDRSLPGLGGGGGQCMPLLLQGQPHDSGPLTFTVGSETYEWQFEIDTSLGGQLEARTTLRQLVSGGVLVGPTAKAELLVVCDDNCVPSFTCTPTSCFNVVQGAGSLGHMTAGAHIDAFKSGDKIIVDVSGVVVARGQQKGSPHLAFTFVCGL